MLPAYEGLDPCDLAGVKIHFRLVVRYEFVTLQGAPKITFDRLPLDSPEIHIFFKKLVISGASWFGLIHGPVGIFPQGFGVSAHRRVIAAADGCRSMKITVIKAMG